jgi:hypothetical protein
VERRGAEISGTDRDQHHREISAIAISLKQYREGFSKGAFVTSPLRGLYRGKLDSLFLYPDRVIVKTFDHGRQMWIDDLQRTIAIPLRSNQEGKMTFQPVAPPDRQEKAPASR